MSIQNNTNKLAEILQKSQQLGQNSNSAQILYYGGEIETVPGQSLKVEIGFTPDIVFLNNEFYWSEGDQMTYDHITGCLLNHLNPYGGNSNCIIYSDGEDFLFHDLYIGPLDNGNGFYVYCYDVGNDGSWNETDYESFCYLAIKFM